MRCIINSRAIIVGAWRPSFQKIHILCLFLNARPEYCALMHSLTQPFCCKRKINENMVAAKEMSKHWRHTQARQQMRYTCYISFGHFFMQVRFLIRFNRLTAVYSLHLALSLQYVVASVIIIIQKVHRAMYYSCVYTYVLYSHWMLFVFSEALCQRNRMQFGFGAQHSQSTYSYVGSTD